MASASRRTGVQLAGVATLVGLLVLTACGGQGGKAPPPPACTSDVECDDTNPCTLDTCDDARECVHAPAPETTVCSTGGGQICDGAGRCVACNHDPQCLGTSPPTTASTPPV